MFTFKMLDEKLRKVIVGDWRLHHALPLKLLQVLIPLGLGGQESIERKDANRANPHPCDPHGCQGTLKLLVVCNELMLLFSSKVDLYIRKM